MNIDRNARYLESHEWARKEGDLIVIGISDHAQHALGDIVFVELPKKGASIAKGKAFGVVESVKAASDVYMPVSGTVEATNDVLAGDPATINRDPYNTGWFIKVKPSNPAEFDTLLSPDDYEAQIKE